MANQDASSAYGSWPSPISAALVAAGGTSVGGPATRNNPTSTGPDLGDHEVWWAEQRPTEGGRSVLVCRESSPSNGDGDPVDRLPSPWSARTRVHEYGGGAWWLGAEATYFANWDDQRLYRFTERDPEPLTPEPAVAHGWRYADGREHPDGQWLVCVREDHHGVDGETITEPANELVAVNVGSKDLIEPVVLASGFDFVSSPRFSPDGRWLSWVRWNHPNMPWDATELCAAPVFANMRLGNVHVVAGGGTVNIAGAGGESVYGAGGESVYGAGGESVYGAGGESVHGADWHSDGRLIFSGDRTGFWNLYSWRPGSEDIAAVTELDGAEIGGPPWVFGVQQWCELGDGRIVAAVTTEAVDRLVVVTGGAELVDVALDGVSTVSGLSGHGDTKVVVVGSGPARLPGVLEVDVATGTTRTHRSPDETGVDPGWFSTGQPLSFVSGSRTAHAFFYPPTGPQMQGPAGQASPLVVIGHGGPTAHATPALSLKVQYWTSRGFAVADVNYGGSSGFGRAYRDLLQGAWGVVDVEDCINVARHLAAEGMVDPDRMAIRGSSAGGLTVLAALQQSDDFGAGTSLYGVADLTALATDTHKFESRYLDGLIGPFPARKDLYDERSPINHTDRLSSPMLVMQGLEDEIVPPSQSEAIVDALAARSIPHAYVTFAGEQHGLRQAENIIRSLEVELWFYGRVFGFDPQDSIEPPSDAVGFA